MQYDAIVLGAGAAGLMAASVAGQRGRRVAVLDHAPEVGCKILISGGGRCNFTNLHCAPENFLSANPHFAKSALARYTPHDFLSLVERHRVPYHEKKLGQLFCDRSARDIVALLAAECAAGSVETHLQQTVQHVRRTTEFIVTTSRAEFRAPALVVATGGLSIPKMGATDLGYRLAKQFSHKVQSCRPALVPLTFTDEDRRNLCDLSGVATEVIATAGPQTFREKMLLTHRGVSGPAILQASSYWTAGGELTLDLLPDTDPTPCWSTRWGQCEPKTLLSEHLPRRLAERWLHLHGDGAHTPALLCDRLRRWTLRPNGTEGYPKAEVTAGGVCTSAFSSKTMESRHVPGLFFIGEVVDVTGHLGGFNFQWAWASGYAAGSAV